MNDPRASRRFLRWTQRVLFVCAVSMLAYCGFVLADGWLFQNRERRLFESLLHETPRAPLANLPPAANGALLGSIEIPRLGLSTMVVEGDTSNILQRAAGHIPGTALPGQHIAAESGNIGISAHRDTFFRPLRNIQQNDLITLTTLAGEYRYRVVSTRIVNPDDIGVLAPGRVPGSDEILTLVTCYPFYFVGAAPNRFIVRAKRVA